MLNKRSLNLFSKLYVHWSIILLQGGDSRDLVWLFYTCIRTERVKKLFMSFLKLNEFFFAVKCQFIALEAASVLVYVLYFLQNLEQRISDFARGDAEKYSVH